MHLRLILPLICILTLSCTNRESNLYLENVSYKPIHPVIIDLETNDGDSMIKVLEDYKFSQSDNILIAYYLRSKGIPYIISKDSIIYADFGNKVYCSSIMDLMEECKVNIRDYPHKN